MLCLMDMVMERSLFLHHVMQNMDKINIGADFTVNGDYTCGRGDLMSQNI